MDRALNLGQILHLYCCFTKPPKNKFVVLVCVEPKHLFFFINSKIHPFISKNPELAACQVPILAHEYEFLDHDSYIDCSEPCSFAIEEIKQQYESDPSLIKGKVSDRTLADIHAAAMKSPKIQPRQRNWILGNN